MLTQYSNNIYILRRDGVFCFEECIQYSLLSLGTRDSFHGSNTHSDLERSGVTERKYIFHNCLVLFIHYVFVCVRITCNDITILLDLMKYWRSFDSLSLKIA